jgi:hypothetical protein
VRNEVCTGEKGIITLKIHIFILFSDKKISSSFNGMNGWKERYDAIGVPEGNFT